MPSLKRPADTARQSRGSPLARRLSLDDVSKLTLGERPSDFELSAVLPAVEPKEDDGGDGDLVSVAPLPSDDVDAMERRSSVGHPKNPVEAFTIWLDSLFICSVTRGAPRRPRQEFCGPRRRKSFV
eukprot:5622995-Prymnesium_polylepis.1